MIGKSEQCNGYTGADLAALVRETGVIALKEFIMSESSDQQSLLVTGDHFKKALTKIRPSVSEKVSYIWIDFLRNIDWRTLKQAKLNERLSVTKFFNAFYLFSVCSNILRVRNV